MLALALCGLAMVSCSTSDSDEVFTPQNYNVIGKVEKGPFVSGSTITIQPMDGKLQVLGSMFNTTITDNVGNFTFGSKEFQAPFAEMMATGYFFNEVKGSLSDGTLVLRALVDLSDNSTVNVNILTHLKYPRIKKLIESGKSFKEANTQAQKELLEAFGLQKYASKDASQFSIVSGTDESAALIAVSSLLLNKRSEGQLTEYLSTLSQEFGNNGVFSASTKAQFKKDREELASKLSDVQSNVIYRYSDLGMNIEVKNLMAYFDWDDDGTAGNESLKEGQTVTLDKTEISVPKEGGTYTISINSPIPVYTEPVVAGPSDPISSDFYGLYDGDNDLNPVLEKSIVNKVLTIKVGKATSKYEQSMHVDLYDCIGNVVGTVNLTIEGDKQGKIPLLGNQGQAAILNVASLLSSAYGNYNLIEQMYYYNKEVNKIPFSTSDSYISKTWSNFYSANTTLLTIKKIDEEHRNAYQEYCDVLYAMYYYSLIVGWGDVPYNYGKIWNDPFCGIARVNTNTIFDDLKSKLNTAIEMLDEKKNTSTTDANGLFFMSKDVARIILANIYMYEGNWKSAEPLLSKVRSNGYYQLDATDENEKTNKGLIFGLYTENGSRSRSVTIKQPLFIPVQSLADVYLSSAECEYHLGNEASAKSLLSKVTSVKGISVSSNVLTGIKEARAKCLLYDSNYFAFLKRNNLVVSECGIQEYQKLFPIPAQELMTNSYMTQNPGY